MDDQFDCRDEVFLDRGYEVLGSVVQATQMAHPDPLDVGQLHAEARDAFLQTLDQVRTDSRSRILLVRGEAGCGKTHLIRALRARIHHAREGAIAYVHMTAEQGDYRQYLLRQVIRSLSDPYDLQADSQQQAGTLDLISDALCRCLISDAAEKLREADDAQLAQLVFEYAETLSEITAEDGRPRFEGISLNTLRIFLYRQSTRKPIQRRVGSFLNGEPLGEMDWQKISAMPRDCDRGPMYLLGELARIIAAALGVPLIVCVDQIEASDLTGANHGPFINAMSTSCELIENITGMMVLLSCLDSAYDAHAPSLIGSYRHRIENEPSAVRLVAVRNAQEIRQILSIRLNWLYERMGLKHVPPDSVYPLPDDLPRQLDMQQLRRILQEVHGYWERCHQAGKLLPWADGQATPAPAEPRVEPDVDRLRIAWNEYRTSTDHVVPEDDEEQISLLAWALGEIVVELEDGAGVQVTRKVAGHGQPPLHALSLVVHEPRSEFKYRLVGLCDKDPRGNGLLKQIETLESLRHPGEMLAVARSTRFPRAGQAARHIKELSKKGDVFFTIDDSAWRTLLSMRSFLGTLAGRFADGVVREWRKTDGPLINLKDIATILRLQKPAADEPPAAPPVASTKPRPAPNAASPARTAAGGQQKPIFDPPRHEGATGHHVTRSAAELPVLVEELTAVRANDSVPPSPRLAGTLAPMVIGQTDELARADVTVDPQVFAGNAAVFGASASGKTVLSMAIAEMLLERGVGVVLFDRKGCFANYGFEEAWSQRTGAPDEYARRVSLRQQIDVHLYTPGCSTGRPLVLPLLPTGLGNLSSEQREEKARVAAAILCEVCAVTAARHDQFATVLSRAIEWLCADERPRTLDELQDLLLQGPQELLNLLPAYAPRHCEEVGRRLNERRVAHGRLLDEHGEKLDLARMLRPQVGRAQLSIISTQFLDGDAATIWVAQFLAAAGRFIQESPSIGGELQAMLMFDEAEQYVPANRRPATSSVMIDLLQRGPAAGLGILLASQNAAEFDPEALEQIATVFGGKITSPRSLEKLRPRIGDLVNTLTRKSPGHFVISMQTQVRAMKASMSLIGPNALPREQIEHLAAGHGRR